MGRIPCCEKENVKRGQWTPEEDQKLSSYIAQNGTRNWRLIPKHAGLQRCGKSCRLRWTNYLRPDLKHGQFSEAEEQTIITLHSVLGNRWSVIAAQLITEIATLPPQQAPNLAEAALGCFKDEMLHLLTKRRIDLQMQQCGTAPSNHNICIKPEDNKDDTIEKIKFGLSKAIKEPDSFPLNKPWDPIGTTSVNLDRIFRTHSGSDSGFRYELAFLGDNGDVSPWSQSLCTGSTCTAGDQHGHLHENLENEQGENSGSRKETRIGSSIFNSDCSLWDLPSDDLINSIS